MLFSRSPFIAFAVRATIGRRWNSGISRTARVASYPSISGIMMSIRTSETSGFDFSASSPSRPFSANTTSMPRRSKTLASVLNDDRLGVPLQTRLLAGRQLLARVHDHRQVAKALRPLDALEQLEAA